MNYLHFLTFSYTGHKDIFCICSLIIGTLELQLLSNLISFLFNLSFKYKVIDSSPLKGTKCSFVPNILYFEVVFNFSNYMREQCKDDKKITSPRQCQGFCDSAQCLVFIFGGPDKVLQLVPCLHPRLSDFFMLPSYLIDMPSLRINAQSWLFFL